MKTKDQRWRIVCAKCGASVLATAIFDWEQMEHVITVFPCKCYVEGYNQLAQKLDEVNDRLGGIH